MLILNRCAWWNKRQRPMIPTPKRWHAMGWLLRWLEKSPPAEEQALREKMLLRFVDGRPVSAITIQFLEWACQELAQFTSLGLLWPSLL